MWPEEAMYWREHMSHYVLRHIEAICGLNYAELYCNQMPQLIQNKPFE